MTWTDFENALVEIHALPAAGLGLVIIGATFRWFEPLSRLLGLRVQSLEQARWVKGRSREGTVERVTGDEGTAGRTGGRVEDQLRRLTRYGQALMMVGVVLVLLSAFLP